MVVLAKAHPITLHLMINRSLVDAVSRSDAELPDGCGYALLKRDDESEFWSKGLDADSSNSRIIKSAPGTPTSAMESASARLEEGQS